MTPYPQRCQRFRPFAGIPGRSGDIRPRFSSLVIVMVLWEIPSRGMQSARQGSRQRVKNCGHFKEKAPLKRGLKEGAGRDWGVGGVRPARSVGTTCGRDYGSRREKGKCGLRFVPQKRYQLLFANLKIFRKINVKQSSHFERY